MLQTLRMMYAFFAILLVSAAVARAGSLPADAELTRNDAGDIIGVRIVGKSNLQRRDVDTETIAALAELANLQYLHLWGTTVDDADIVTLSTLVNLQMIDLTFTDITGESLRVLATLPKLVWISLEGCGIADDHLEALSNKTELIELRLSKTKITDAGLEHIRNLKQLLLLDLSDCDITDSGLSSLGDLPQIRSLWISKLTRYGYQDRSDLTDQCIDYLATLKSLKDLRIADSKLTAAGVERLRQSLPNATVSTERSGVTYLNRTKDDKTSR